MDYLGIIKTAYKTTINHPKLWFFGLALLHTLTLIFVYLQIIALHLPASVRKNFLMFWHSSFDQIMAKNTFSMLITVAAVVISSFAYIFLVLYVAKILKFQHLDKRGQKKLDENEQTPNENTKNKPEITLTKRGLKFFWPVVSVHLLETLILGLIFYSLFAFPDFGDIQSLPQTVILVISLILFFPAILLVVSQQLFASLFIILYEIKFSAAMLLGWRLLLHKWQELLGIAVPVLLIYAVLMFSGFGVASIIQRGIVELRETLTDFGVPSLFAIITLAQILGIIFLWAWLAILHSFVITVFVLFFHGSVGPVTSKDEVAELGIRSLSSSSASSHN